MAETTCYLVIEPEWRTRYDGTQQLAGIKATRLTRNRPNRPHGATIRLRLKVPDAVFMPFAPDVTIEIPADAVHYEPVVTVVPPEGEPTEPKDH